MNHKRQHVRVDYTEPVTLIVNGAEQEGHAINISQGGIFVSSQPQPPFGSTVILKIKLPGIPKFCEISSIVRWCKDEDGVGLQFEQLRAIEVWAINKLLSSIQK